VRHQAAVLVDLRGAAIIFAGARRRLVALGPSLQGARTVGVGHAIEDGGLGARITRVPIDGERMPRMAELQQHLAQVDEHRQILVLARARLGGGILKQRQRLLHVAAAHGLAALLMQHTQRCTRDAHDCAQLAGRRLEGATSPLSKVGATS
jgi:hypothetical protein